MTLPDPTGRLLTEIRDDVTVAGLVSGRVRGGEPAAGDALGPGHYQAFIVIVRMGGVRLRRAPIQEVRLAARCYAATAQGAAALAGAVSDAVHARGHRITPAGLSIFGSFDEGGGGASKDPDTGQPMEVVFISVGALSETLPI
jgi:hypothetical protein